MVKKKGYVIIIKKVMSKITLAFTGHFRNVRNKDDLETIILELRKELGSVRIKMEIFRRKTIISGRSNEIDKNLFGRDGKIKLLKGISKGRIDKTVFFAKFIITNSTIITARMIGLKKKVGVRNSDVVAGKSGKKKGISMRNSFGRIAGEVAKSIA